MPTAVSLMMLAVSALVTMLLTLLLAQVTGLRTDMKEMIKDQLAQKDRHSELRERVIKLETEHADRRRICRTNSDGETNA